MPVDELPRNHVTSDDRAGSETLESAGCERDPRSMCSPARPERRRHHDPYLCELRPWRSRIALRLWATSWRLLNEEVSPGTGASFMILRPVRCSNAAGPATPG